MSRRFWTSDLALLLADGMISALFTLGIVAPLFYTRLLESSWFAAIAGCLLATALVVLLSRRWWLVPGLLLLIGLPGVWILSRLKLLSLWILAIRDSLTWAGVQLWLGGP